MKQLSKAKWIRLACFSAGGDSSLLSGAADFDAAARSGKRQCHGYFGYVRQSGLYGCRWLAFELLWQMGHLYSDGADRPVWDFRSPFLWGNRLEYGDQLPSDCLYHLFLKTDYEQETADAGTKESGKLPEGNGEKVIEWTADYKNPPSIVIICPVK